MMFTHEQITPHIIRLSLPGNVYAYLFCGEKRTLLADTGCGYDDLAGYVRSLTDLPLTVWLTHGHVDHAGGASQFAEVYMNEKDTEICRMHTHKAARGVYLKANGVSPKDDLMADMCRETLPLRDNDEIDLGGIHVAAWECAGHTPGSMVFCLKEERIVLLGDACNSLTYLQLDHCLSIKQYLANLQKFRTEHYDAFDTCLYSHPHNYGGKEIIDEAVEGCEEIIAGHTGEKTKRGYLAFPVDEHFRRADGKSFNCIYRMIE